MLPDFSGWATKYGVKCSDGRIIRHKAFLHHKDGARFPLVWQHDDSGPDNVLGYGVITHKDEGVRVDGFFNDTPVGIQAKALVQHGDLDSLSIHANKLKETPDKVVTHGNLVEISLAILGANPEARIDNLALAHSDTPDITEAIIHSAEKISLPADEKDENLSHADEDDNEEESESTDSGDSLADVIASMTDQQKEAMYTVVALASDDADDSDSDSDEEETTETAEHADSDSDDLTHQEESDMTNVFEANAERDGDKEIKHAVLTNSKRREIVHKILDDAPKMGSFKDAYLKHAGEYGLDNIEVLFPDAKAGDNAPQFLSREMAWVPGVLNDTRKQPFSRVKSLYADITAKAARAKGYVKGNEKFDEVFPLFKRATTPTTIYKKQKLDRDDIIDIEDFDVVSWLRQEMRVMLNEEIARAILVGDNRENTDPDKVSEPASTTSEGAGIRSIKNDADLYSVKVPVGGIEGGDLVETILRGKKEYKGSGAPTLYTTVDVHVDMLLAKDGMGRRLYNSDSELALALGVSKIVDVEVMEEYDDVVGIIVNLADYTIGTSRGGQITNFDDFDIDFNQYKYLMETRLSGGLTKVKSALVLTSTAPEPEAG